MARVSRAMWLRLVLAAAAQWLLAVVVLLDGGSGHNAGAGAIGGGGGGGNGILLLVDAAPSGPSTYGHHHHHHHHLHHHQQLPTFGSSDVQIGPARGNSSAKFIRPGVKGGISISRTCKNCASYVMYAGWNMPMGVVGWQVLADLLVGVALLSVPIQLYVYISNSKKFPYPMLLVSCGALAATTGLSHMLEVLSLGNLPRVLLLLIASCHLLSALAALSAAIAMYCNMPDIFTVHERAIVLKNKVEEANKESARMIEAHEVALQLRLIGQRVRATLDRGAIVSTALLELREMLGLDNAALWLPGADASAMELTNECEHRPSPVTTSIPLKDSTISQVISSKGAVIIASTSSLAELTALPPPLGTGRVGDCGAAAFAVPLLDPEDPERKEGLEYGIVCLVLPGDAGRKFRQEVLDMIDAVADQLTMALLHAAVLEDSRREYEALMEEAENLRRAELEGKSAVRARDNFLQVMNAKMRTPMHSITALSSLLAESDLNDEQRSMAETVAFSSTLLASLLYDILEFWRLEEDNMKLQIAPEQFELPALVTEAETLSSPIARDKGLLVEFKPDAQLPENVIGDGNRLLQVLLNVVGNAIKHTSRGSITVTVAPERMEWARDSFVLKAEAGHTFIRFEVKDTGCDLNPTDIPKMFDKFQDDESKTSRTGLGLALSRKFVQLMNGHIWLESNGPGKGATCKFIVMLKLDTEGDQGDRNEYDDDGPDVNFFALRIMVVDDNMVNRLVTKRLLDRIGISTRCVESGKECLRILAEEQDEEKYDVLLLDLMMPEMDGYTVANKIRTELKSELQPMIVALTANTDETTREQCLAHGMKGMITKPISLKILRDVLGKILGQAKQADL